MAKNNMSKVAKLLGLELREEFKIKGLSSKYRFTDIGLQCYSETGGYWLTSNKLLPILLQGEISIIKVEQPILDDIEKKYLSNVIKPFRNTVISIAKRSAYNNLSYIAISLKKYLVEESVTLPYFEQHKMYKNMKLDKVYTLEELGL